MTPQLPNFDRIARPYRWLEYLSLGPILQRTRTRHLDRLQGCRRALLLGDGDGRFTAALMAQNPLLRATAVDLSQSMLTLLRRNAAAAGAESRLQTHHADARCFTPDSEPDLIVTHFFLDCLTQTEVDSLIARLACSIAPAGFWLISEFRIPDGLLRWPARLYIRGLYLAFRLLTGLSVDRLPHHAAALTRAGLRPVAGRQALFGLLTSELWQSVGSRGDTCPTTTVDSSLLF